MSVLPYMRTQNVEMYWVGDGQKRVQSLNTVSAVALQSDSMYWYSPTCVHGRHGYSCV